MSKNMDLQIIQTLTAQEIFEGGDLTVMIDQIEKNVKSVVIDPSTKKGRDEIITLAVKVRDSKTYIEKTRKKYIEDKQEFIKKVNAVSKIAWDRLETLQHEVRSPVTAFEEKEKNRVRSHEEKISFLVSFLSIDISQGSSNLKLDLERLESIKVDDSWEEFKDRGNKAKEESLIFLHEAIAKRIQYESEQAELQRLREEDAARKQKEHEEKIAKEAAAKAKAEAERIAQENERKAKLEAERLENEKQEAIKRQAQAEEATRLAEEKAKKDKIEAELRAKEAAKKAEADKLAAIEKAREEERIFALRKKEQEEKEQAKREANVKHLQLINNEALGALVACVGLDNETAKKVVTAIAKGEIPNIKINY